MSRLYAVFEPDSTQQKEPEPRRFTTGMLEEGLTLRAVLGLTDFEEDEVDSILELGVGQFVQIDQMCILRTDQTP